MSPSSAADPLLSLLHQYASLQPLHQLELPSSLVLARSQDWIVHGILENPQLVRYPPNKRYRKEFLKILVARLEQGCSEAAEEEELVSGTNDERHRRTTTRSTDIADLPCPALLPSCRRSWNRSTKPSSSRCNPPQENRQSRLLRPHTHPADEDGHADSNLCRLVLRSPSFLSRTDPRATTLCRRLYQGRPTRRSSSPCRPPPRTRPSLPASERLKDSSLSSRSKASSKEGRLVFERGSRGEYDISCKSSRLRAHHVPSDLCVCPPLCHQSPSCRTPPLARLPLPYSIRLQVSFSGARARIWRRLPGCARREGHGASSPQGRRAPRLDRSRRASPRRSESESRSE